MDEDYKQSLAPVSVKRKGSQVEVVANTIVNMKIHIADFINVDANKATFTIVFRFKIIHMENIQFFFSRLESSWRDPRLRFTFLHNDSTSNHIPAHKLKEMWRPQFKFFIPDDDQPM